MKKTGSLLACCLLALAFVALGCEPSNRILCDEVADPCAYPGDVQCSADGLAVQSCLGNTDGCLVWTDTASCAADAPCDTASGQAACGCENACPEAGASACADTVIQTCALGADGCLDWVDTQDCADADQFCDNTASPVVCADACTDECQDPGTSTCRGTEIVSCLIGADGCSDLTVDQDCADDGMFCDASGAAPACSSTCTDRCPETGLTTCDGTVILLCQTVADGCLDWVVDRDCADDDMFCDSNSQPVRCSETCTDDCQGQGQKRCDGAAILVCAPGADGCLDWVVEENCALADPPGVCGMGPSGFICVDACGADTDCANGQYCALPTCDAPAGACSVRPEGCPDIWEPVCGCDGQTYGNECEAAAVGVSVEYYSQCEVAYCVNDLECADSEYCLFAVCGQERGQCTARPTGCEEIYQPVCGCDGVSYDNACLAAAAGISVAYQGLCQAEFCWDNGMCAESQYCYFQVCAQETGVCMERPLDCPDLWQPVCGCDGTTYGNACEAAAAGVSVDFQGACEAEYCWSNDMCGTGRYCFFAFCGLETGVCQDQPLQCPDVWDPVCGCDGTTYGNACEAAVAGVSVDYAGVCENRTCTNTNQCLPGNYCLFAQCSDQQGQCVSQPGGCPDVWDPVCGCDGRTYGNACEAAAAGASVDYLGACESAGCSINTDCSQMEYCLFDACADQTGQCTPRPGDCPYLWDPVCGCDGLTYANDCLAGQQGVSVDHAGECQAATCRSNEDCLQAGNTAQYCLLPSCDASDAGVCLPVPVTCPDIWSPVCGCDGQTYGNECEAAMASMSVAYEGECQ